MTDTGKLYVILFQTFAFLQLFNVLNARRPSYKDLNPLAGMKFTTALKLLLLIGFQFGLAYLPLAVSHGTIDI